jgi:myo-inositol-1(or 4)-monophosphatase
MKELKDLVREIERAALETAAFIRGEARGFDISVSESKGINNFVSYVDRKAEEMLVSRLAPLVGNAGFLAEEGTESGNDSKHIWVIDPLDGTTNFLHGLAPYAISIGLLEDGEPVAGVVYVVTSGEMFSGWKDGGAWLNGERIQVSSANSVADSLVATGFPYSDFSRMDDYMKCLSHLWKYSHGIRRLGSAATDIAYVACGRFEIFYEYGLHPWDIAAATIILREAGGVISDFSGNEKRLSGQEIVASNKAVYSEIVEILNTFMGS